MKEAQNKVREFHQAFECVISDTPALLNEQTSKLRADLIQEELDEYKLATEEGDIVGIADALGDLAYVVLGAAVSHGIPMDEVFDEVHRSNMTKIGGWKREDGKWMKPPTYEKPDLTKILFKDAGIV